MTKLRDLFPLKQGKVRDIYDLGDKLLIIATDRISAFDYILQSIIPGKGILLNQISKFWFDKTRHIIQNHIISTNINDYPDIIRNVDDDIENRSMLVIKAEKFPIECIVRGYITGSGWKDYKKTGKVCGIELPNGLRESEKLQQPLFTPSTKAEEGHDENISLGEMKKIIDPDLAEKIKTISIALYNFAHDLLLDKDIILADTKFEFGIYQDEIILIDEIFTPDSSRLWNRADYMVGRSQKSYDKQFVRDYLLSQHILEKKYIQQDDEILILPDEIIEKTRDKYMQAYKKITGRTDL